MVTENVDIRFRSTGTRVIKRRIDQIGVAANNATRGIFLMQRALFVLGGAGVLRALSSQVDLLTTMENRLKLTTTGTQNLEQVQTALFEVARKSRTSFEAVADTYSRTALSVRALGVSQEELLRFTESLSKATIISGASSREANAAMVQLGQGMASSRLSGDELRSVLEQLPFVADIIAKQLGVTRGELREFGRAGKITSEVVLDAFKSMESEIDRLFAQTQVTIAQAFTVAHTNILEFIDTVDDATNASNKLGLAIIAVSENLDLIIAALGAVALGFAASFTGNMISRLSTFVSTLRAGSIVSARMTEIENLRSAGAARRARTQLAVNVADRRAIAQGIIQLRQTRTMLVQQKIQQGVEVKGFRTRSLVTGQFVNRAAAQTALNRTTIQLIATDQALKTSNAQLVASNAAVTTSTNAVTVAAGRAGAANAASAGFMARLTRTFPRLAGAALAARGAVAGLWAILAANPIGLIIAGVVGTVVAFKLWGNAIKVTEDGVVGLKDATIAAFELIAEAVEPATVAIVDGFSWTVEKVASGWDLLVEATDIGFGMILSGAKWILNKLIGVALGTVVGIIKAMQTLPRAFNDLAITASNFVIQAFYDMEVEAVGAVNTIIEAINSVKPGKPIELLDEPILELIVNDFKGAGTEAGDAFRGGFADMIDRDYIGAIASALGVEISNVTDAVLDRARANIAALAAEKDTITKGDRTGDPTVPKKDGKNKPTFAKELAEIERRTAVLALSNAEQKIANGLARISKKLKRELTEGEIKLADAALRRLEQAKIESELLQEIIGPREQNIAQMQALNTLFEEGAIGLEDYNNKMIELKKTADEVSGTFAGGFKTAFADFTKTTQELGRAFGDLVKGGIDSAADALVEFAKTGKLNIKALFAELFAQLLKSMAIQLLMKALGLVIPGGGAPGGGAAGALAAATGAGSQIGLAGGGSIMPSGPGSTDSQFISFNKRPDERVDILTPGQQRAQSDAMGNGQGGTTVVSSPPVNVAAVLSREDIIGAFDGDEGETLIVDMIARNASTVKSVLG